MNKFLMALKVLFFVVLFYSLAYFGYKTYIFSTKVTKAFEYTYAAIECLIQESGQNESDVDILFKGYKSREEYVDAVNKESPGFLSKDPVKREPYNGHIPECKKFYSQYRCWTLDTKDPISLENCGPRFMLTPEEIVILKKDPTQFERIWRTKK